MVRMEIKKLYFVTQKSRYLAENLIVEELCSIADLMGDNSKVFSSQRFKQASPSKSFPKYDHANK